MRGYDIGIHDNDSYAFYGRSDVCRCKSCGELLNKWGESLTGLKVRRRRKWALSTTYDGIDVASSVFREFYENHNLAGLVFTHLPDDPAFYKIVSNIIVPYDWESAALVFLRNASFADNIKR